MPKRQSSAASNEAAAVAAPVKEKRRAREVGAETPIENVPRRTRARRPAKPREVDFVVIGGGSGGVAAARRAAALGARTVLVERDAIGGTCVHRGCVPKKMLSYGAGWASILATGLANTGGKEDWRDAIVRVNAEVARLTATFSQRLHESGVEILHGDAELSAPGEIRIGNETLRARKILLSTGAHPRALAVPGGELVSTSDDIFTWQSLPGSLVVIGGGYIAVEQASILSRYGVKVDLLVREDRLLQRFDADISRALAEALANKGVRVHLNTEVTLVSQANGAYEVCYTQQGRKQSVRAQAVLAAIGRDPNVEGLGLEAVGVALGEERGIVVDKQFRTSVRGVYAVGDCTEGLQLTPVAVSQARWLADRLFGKRGDMVDFDVVPTAVFSEPAIGAVGLTEAEAIEAAGKPERIRTEIRRFVSLENRFAGVSRQSVFKLVLNARSGRVLGAHLMDNAAPEIIQVFALAMRLGVKASHLKTTLPLHPTVAEELFG